MFGADPGILSFEVYRHHSIRRDTLLASVGIPIGDFDIGDDAELQKEMVIHKRKSNDDRLKLSLKTQRSVLSSSTLTSTSTTAPSATNPEGIISEAIEDSSKELTARIENDLVNLEDEVEKVRRQTERCKHIYLAADAIIEKLDYLSEISEIARAASIVMSGICRVGDFIVQCFVMTTTLLMKRQIIKAKHEQNEAIVELYDIMIETHKIAVEKEALNEESEFAGLFDEIVRQSEECYVFLSNYMYKGRLYQVMDFWSSPSKIEDFNSAFEQLKKRFIETQVEVTTVTVLNTQKAVESLEFTTSERENTLRLLQSHKTVLGPKSHCLKGTRRSSISKILDWCFNGEQTVLWISGIAGCGKSSLIGTLHNSLSTMGFHSRLAAFVRFDRSTYNNAGEFIRVLAFLLASFDERFGKRIAEVVERSRQIAQNTDLSMQVQKLLINPLRGLSEEIAKEGRIVVLVDAIDECSREDQAETRFREQLLELFEKDAFRLLPFLRFVLASRPEEDIILSLQHCSHIYHFPLDHNSSETTNDIHYFLSKSFERPCFINLKNAQKHAAVDRLAERASGLFIWATTVVTFIGDNVEQRLKVFVEQEPPKNALHALTALYEIALESLVREGDEDIQQNICMALGLIMATSVQFAQFLIHVLHDLVKYVDRDKAPGVLSAFHKLRSLVTEESGKYQLLHKSFDDFLSSKDRAHHWYIDTEKYKKILFEAMITCTMDHLDKADEELPEALSPDLYRYAIMGPRLGVRQDLSLRPSLQQTLEKFLLGYVEGGSDFQRYFGLRCHEQAMKLHHNSEFMKKAWFGASQLQHIYKEPLVVKDFFNIMLYDAALAGKVTKTHSEDQPSLEWEVDNIYMSVFVQMAGGSNVYEKIVEVLDTKPIPPVVSLGPEIEMPIKIVSRGRMTMKSGSVRRGKEASTKDFIEWGEYRLGDWRPIAEPQDRDW
ncbi:hypothetical protein VNI00_015177 [Paramarasmius palmivorus]|uniref:NACHT domain-containing protein n=1 Tax=Paramarasmius palmivorus TaxID=297713 RepID=A0AAW0BN11_9AGAR